ncbi:DUF58 domain-containing protein [Alexandriicola marinus]|uniref:DUF58 domain-containing protein n=1 Tax=Alexandriicola marinus TaxID=2081710 RepID=UPI001F0C6209|nr:DUF58 domain-containing protein [Alexandriicola marinus]
MTEADAPLQLRSGAEALAAPLPPLLAEAEHLARNVHMGEHGRRRAGLGDLFWQYRPAQDHDEVRSIDWRRSARSDGAFVQDKEWQVAQSVTIWADDAASMSFASRSELHSKAYRARLLGLATAILLSRGGERVGLPDLPPRSGRAQIARMAARFTEDGTGDYGHPDARGMASHSRALFLSDFLGPLEPVEEALTSAADRGVHGAIVQVLDPAEEAFPFDGRTIFESMGGTFVHETLKAGDLRERYIQRLAERKERLLALSRLTGWQFLSHHTGDPAAPALMWIFNAMERRL